MNTELVQSNVNDEEGRMIPASREMKVLTIKYIPNLIHRKSVELGSKASARRPMKPGMMENNYPAILSWMNQERMYCAP